MKHDLFPSVFLLPFLLRLLYLIPLAARDQYTCDPNSQQQSYTSRWYAGTYVIHWYQFFDELYMKTQDPSYGPRLCILAVFPHIAALLFFSVVVISPNC